MDYGRGGIVGFNSISHFPRPQVIPVLRGFYRVLRPNGVFLLSLHVGQEVRRVEEWWGEPGCNRSGRLWSSQSGDPCATNH